MKEKTISLMINQKKKKKLHLNIIIIFNRLIKYTKLQNKLKNK